MYWAATPASTITSHSAACTTLSAGDDAAWPPHHDGGDQAEGDVLGRPSVYFFFLSAPDFELGARARSPSTRRALLVVEQVGDRAARSTRTPGSRTSASKGTPRRRCRSTCRARSRCRSGRASLTVRGLPPARRGGGLLLVALDVDAPVGALAGAQHADRAVLLLERDHAPGTRAAAPPSRGGTARWRAPPASLGLVVWTWSERDAETLHQAGELGHLEHHLQHGGDHDVARARSGSGTSRRTVCSWSSRKRG